MLWTWEKEQLEPGRLKRALGAELTPLHITEESATFAGSSGSVYSADLQSCTCKDFAISKLPCKHMIRLAIVLGYISCEGMSEDKSAAAEKLALGQLEQNIKTAPIAEVMALIHSLRCAFSGERLKLIDHPYLEGNPLISIDKHSVICPVKRHQKSLNTLAAHLASRIGDLAVEHLYDVHLVNALSDLEVKAISLEELAEMIDRNNPEVRGTP